MDIEINTFDDLSLDIDKMTGEVFNIIGDNSKMSGNIDSRKFTVEVSENIKKGSLND